MTRHALVAEAMSLPLSERVELAQALWASIDANLHDSDEQEAIREACRRDDEITTGIITPISHADAMKAARKAIGCH